MTSADVVEVSFLWQGTLSVVVCYQQVLSSLIVEQICSNFLPGKTGYIVRMQGFLLLTFQELYVGGAVNSHVHNIIWDAQPKDTVSSFQLTLFHTKVALVDDL